VCGIETIGFQLGDEFDGHLETQEMLMVLVDNGVEVNNVNNGVEVNGMDR
jgi:hypothetical protein